MNQHTEHGLLTFSLAADITLALRTVGFVLANELVWSKDRTGGKWGSWGSQRPIFGSYPYPPNLLFKNVHEYIIVVAKPPIRSSWMSQRSSLMVGRRTVSSSTICLGTGYEFEVVVNPESGTLADVAFSGATCLDRLAIHPGFRPQQPNTGGHPPHDGRPE